MSVAGIFQSHQHIAGQRTGDFDSALLYSQRGGMTPLLAVSSGFETQEATDTVVTWFEENHLEGRARANGQILAAATTLIVDDGSPYAEGTIFEVESTGEHVLCTAISGNSLTLVRGFAGTTAATIADDAYLHRIGNAREEGSSMPTPVANQGAPRVNVTQIFRNAWGITGTATAVTYRQGNKLAKNKRDAAGFHAEDKERAFIWGKKHIGMLNGKPMRTMDGLVSQIEQYGGTIWTVAGGNAKLDLLRDHIRQLFAFNIKGLPNERIAYCGDLALQVFSECARLDGTHELVTEDTQFGIKVHSFIGPFGTLKLMTHPMFSMNPTKANDVLCLHPGAIKRRVLRKTMENNIDPQQASGVDAKQGDFLSEETITLGIGKVHSYIDGAVTATTSS